MTVDLGITGKSIGKPEWGYVGIVSFDYQPNERVGYIELVVVQNEFQRRGYGKILVMSAMEIMESKGVATVFTAPVKLGSPEFFHALGFKPYKNTPLFYKSCDKWVR